MSKLLKDLVRKRFRGFVGGSSSKPRCRASNPSKQLLRDKHASLPTEEELTAFEISYAGPQTAELVERYSGQCLYLLFGPREFDKEIQRGRWKQPNATRIAWSVFNRFGTSLMPCSL